jgi:predicted chitinase
MVTLTPAEADVYEAVMETGKYIAAAKKLNYSWSGARGVFSRVMAKFQMNKKQLLATRPTYRIVDERGHRHLPPRNPEPAWYPKLGGV